MSGGDHGATKVAQNIYRRQGGTYSVSLRVNGLHQRKTVASLEEAIQWRDDMLAVRKDREPSGSRGATAMLSVEGTEDRQHLREMIANAPRKKIKINGRSWTLVLLPEQAIR